MTPNTNFNPDAAMKAQIRYCDTHEVPMYAPSNGLCFHCGYNIYLPINGSHGAVYGITVEDAGKRLITSCPFCNHSFVE